MPKEVTVEIELDDGTNENFVLKRIKQEHQEILSGIMMSKGVRSSDPSVTLDGPTWENYRLHVVFLSLKSPEKFKNKDTIRKELDAMDFSRLYEAAMELNGLSQRKNDEDEKK